ncbi:MAG: hypothetical protein CMQ49_01580 [Gammaproteobacteria bacterium]|nr:hypothetical protein [Gammaproteobacteria bacterium]
MRFTSRRDMTDEFVAVMHTPWRDEAAECHGERFELQSPWSHPKPAQPGKPSALIDSMVPRTFDAIGRYAAG